MTQAGEHNPYNPSPVYCISPPTCTLSLSLSLWNPKRKKNHFFIFLSDQGRPHRRGASLGFWSEGRKFYFRWSVSKPKLKPEDWVQYPRHRYTAAEKLVGSDPTTTHHSERTRATRGPCRGCHQNLEAKPNQRCPGCNHLQRSRTGSARCAASCCTSPWYLHAATPFAFGALTGVCLTLAYRSVPCVDRNSRTCLA